MIRVTGKLSSMILGGAALLLMLCAPVQAQEATYVGEQVCMDCHPAQADNFAHTLHAKVFRKDAKNDLEKKVCEACHGPGSNHASNPTDRSALIGFTRTWPTPTEKRNGQCLQCHDGGNRINWFGSMHQSKNLACSDCHNPMAKFSQSGLLKRNSIIEVCFTCHQQQRAEFSRKSHMPLMEGKISCEDCHNPHGSTGPRLLKAESVNEVCYVCHAEKRGPFLWEHPPVRENCLNCHLPHGSNNDKLLKQSRPMLCNTCHAFTGGMGHTFRNPVPGLPAVNGTNPTGPAAQIVGRSCQNCHAQIHGSNSPDGTRFRR